MARGKYARKRMRKQLQAVALADLGLSAHTVKALSSAGLTRLADLAYRSEAELEAIHGIGSKAMVEIRNVRNERLAMRI